MSGALPLRALPRDADAEVPAITLADAIELRVPICFLVEPDRVWAEGAVTALLEEFAASADAHGGGGATVARWTRTRRWVSFGASYGFALAGSDAAAGEVDVLDEIVRLTEHLASARPGDGAHALQGALFSVRCAPADMERPLATEVLVDAALQLMNLGASLLIELPVEPGAAQGVDALGPLFGLPRSPRLRYEAMIDRVRSAARAAGAAEPAAQDVADAFAGLSRMQADLVSRVVQAECQIRGDGADVLRLLAAAKERAVSVLRGGAE